MKKIFFAIFSIAIILVVQQIPLNAEAKENYVVALESEKAVLNLSTIADEKFEIVPALKNWTDFDAEFVLEYNIDEAELINVHSNKFEPNSNIDVSDYGSLSGKVCGNITIVSVTDSKVIFEFNNVLNLTEDKRLLVALNSFGFKAKGDVAQIKFYVNNFIDDNRIRTKAEVSGSNIVFAGHAPSSVSNQLTLTIWDGDGKLNYLGQTSITDGKFSISAVMPDSAKSGTYVARLNCVDACEQKVMQFKYEEPSYIDRFASVYVTAVVNSDRIELSGYISVIKGKKLIVRIYNEMADFWEHEDVYVGTNDRVSYRYVMDNYKTEGDSYIINIAAYDINTNVELFNAKGYIDTQLLTYNTSAVITVHNNSHLEIDANLTSIGAVNTYEEINQNRIFSYNIPVLCPTLEGKIDCYGKTYPTDGVINEDY